VLRAQTRGKSAERAQTELAYVLRNGGKAEVYKRLGAQTAGIWNGGFKLKLTKILKFKLN
jgi:hypothetical protein